ncbi:MAG: phosphoribosyltransferase [Steroidobacteraceae bacterium]
MNWRGFQRKRKPAIAKHAVYGAASPANAAPDIPGTAKLRPAAAGKQYPLERLNTPMDKLFISANSLLRDSMELARLIVRSGFRPTFLVAMWRGGAPIGIAVQEVLEYHSIHADHIAIRTSSYIGIGEEAKTVRVHALDYLVSRLSAEDQLLLVDDVFDSGRSLEAVLAELKRRCRRNLPDQIRIATVYYKPARNRSTLVPDYYVQDTDRWLVFPHEIQGLTRQEILEHKPVGTNFFDPVEP